MTKGLERERECINKSIRIHDNMPKNIVVSLVMNS